MNRNIQPKRAGPVRRPTIATEVESLDHARRAYLQSANRLDLSKLAAAFANAPESVHYAGKSPKTK